MLVEAKVLRQRRGSAEGGEASPRIYASIGFAYYPARPATSERGAADSGKHASSVIEGGSRL